MKKYNFQDWLKAKVSDDSEVILAGKLEYLRLYLTDAMRELRTQAGLTQAQLAQELGVQQAAVSKLESALKDHELESVLKYLHTLGAQLLIGVKQGEKLYQVSDTESGLLIDVPIEVQQLASIAGMSPREYVLSAIEHFSHKATSLRLGSVTSVRQKLTMFLESDDSVAVQVRERLRDKTISETAAELENCLSISEEDDRISAVKKVLAGGVTTGGNNRDSGDDNDEIELLDLAEELLDKLAKMLGNRD
ncbi:MAG TPA: transcriptional regulator [Cyanobacteria bacterium UBA8543]|nr:transcriptional regulator [Cyanobacteria bacterium UBA8543]